MWNTLSPYLVPPFAASGAIILVFRDMILKSAQQKGQPLPSIPFRKGLIEGAKAAPTVGLIVGSQMVIQKLVEKTLLGESKKSDLSTSLKSSAIVGTISAPFLAIFNGQTMGWSVMKSLRNFNPWQGLAIAVQETGFVGGLSASDRLAEAMKGVFGNNKAVEYMAAFTSGALGSLAGHPANTALTRWQSGMRVDSLSQSMWGSARKARAVGLFSVLYKFAKETLTPTKE